MIAGGVAWRWSDVDATTTAHGTHLSHRTSGAELLVRAGRLVGAAGYARASPAVRRNLARVGAMVRLRERGRYLIHAAGAVDPSGRGWLLAGESGAGKSTLAYALSRAGWRVLGDDGVLIGVDALGVTAYPWNDPLRVSSSLACAFPELAEHASRARAGDSRHRIPMTAPGAGAARVSAVILLERAEVLAVAALGPVEALGTLVRQSPCVLIDDAHARAHLDALRRAASLPCFRFRHTPAELHTIAQILGDLLPG